MRLLVFKKFFKELSSCNIMKAKDKKNLKKLKKEMSKCDMKTGCATSCGTGCGGYCLGFIGAAVYYISTATGFWNGVLGLLKAVVWPAFLVFEVLKYVAA